VVATIADAVLSLFFRLVSCWFSPFSFSFFCASSSSSLLHFYHLLCFFFVQRVAKVSQLHRTLQAQAKELKAKVMDVECPTICPEGNEPSFYFFLPIFTNSIFSVFFFVRFHS
jgi:hypothetical protein